MNSARKVGFVTGTIDFRYDFQDDIVFAKARWTLDTPAEVMRWYDMHSRYFNARFKRPKDLVVDQEGLVVAPHLTALFERYSARLHETMVRYSAVVAPRPRLRLAPRSGEGSALVSIEAATLEEAVAAIREVRQSDGRARESAAKRLSSISGVRFRTLEFEAKK